MSSFRSGRVSQVSHPDALIARARRAGSAVTAVALAFLVSCCVAPFAWGYVDVSDVVREKTAADREMSAEGLPNIDATHAALIDEEGTLWYGRAADESVQIASLTKLMTALVAAEHLDAASTIVVTPEAASVGESSAGLLSGDVMTFDTALKAVLCASGNDAASAVAQAAGAVLLADQGRSGDAATCEAAFVDAMNAKAAELGLTATLYTNPHGLDFDRFAQGQYSSARDTARVLRAAMGIDLVRANVGYSQVDIVVERGGAQVVLTLHNTDTLLESYPGTCAAKTGYTLAAGPCVATAVNRGDGHEYYAVVLGSSSKPQRFIDSQALYDWVLANRDKLEADDQAAQAEETPKPEEAAEPEMVRYQLITAPHSITMQSGNAKTTRPLVATVAHTDWVNRTFTATVDDANVSIEVPAAGGRVNQEVEFFKVSGEVHTGDVVGHLAFRQEGTTVWEADMVAAEDVAAPTWWESAGVALDRFFRGLFGQPTVAESELLNLGAQRVS